MRKALWENFKLPLELEWHIKIKTTLFLVAPNNNTIQFKSHFFKFKIIKELSSDHITLLWNVIFNHNRKQCTHIVDMKHNAYCSKIHEVWCTTYICTQRLKGISVIHATAKYIKYTYWFQYWAQF